VNYQGGNGTMKASKSTQKLLLDFPPGYSSPLLSCLATEPSLFRIPLRLDLTRCPCFWEAVPSLHHYINPRFSPWPESGCRPSSVGCGDQSEQWMGGIKHRDSQASVISNSLRFCDCVLLSPHSGNLLILPRSIHLGYLRAFRSVKNSRP